MFTLILILLGGFLAGFLLRRLPGIHFTDTDIPVTIFAMLFLFGLSLGADQSLISRFSSFGRQALVMALLGVAGSLLFSWLAGKYLLKHPKNESEDER